MDAQLRLIPRSAPRRGDGASAPAAHDETPRPRPARRARPSLTAAPDAAEAPTAWRIDEAARARGRVGIDQARQALRQARRPLPGDRHTTAA